MQYKGLRAQVEAMQGRHVQRGAAIAVLDVGVGPSLGQDLHAQSPAVGEGGVVHRSLALVVQGVDAHL